jgi:hypothetical protein
MAIAVAAMASSTASNESLAFLPVVASAAHISQYSLPTATMSIPKGGKRCVPEDQLKMMSQFAQWAREPLGYAATGAGRRMNSARTAQVLSEDVRYITGLLVEYAGVQLPLHDFSCFKEECNINIVLKKIIELQVSNSRRYNICTALEKVCLFSQLDQTSRGFSMITALKRQTATDRKKQQKISHQKKPTSAKWLTTAQLRRLARKLKEALDRTVSMHALAPAPLTLRQALAFQKNLILAFFIFMIPQRTQVVKSLHLGSTLLASDR